MTQFILRYGAWLIILVSFLVPAFSYGSIPDKVLITRDIFGGSDVYADKSLFTVYRVPLIDLISALAFLMLSRASVKDELKTPFMRFFSALIFTAALKSLVQSLETILPGLATVFFYVTAGLVLTGILTAAVLGRRFLSSIRNSEFDLGRLEKAALFVLLFAYLGVAFFPIAIFGGI